MSMSPSTVPVQIPRELVLASAGTGKTFRISSRIIGLLAAGGHPDAIFASTFTRKAAGEILDRVLIRLAAAALGEDCARELSEAALFDKSSAGPEFWRRLLERLVSELHRVNIGTLDSFFVRAVTSFADEVGLPPGWRIADEAVAARVREEALREVLDQADRGVLLELLRGLANGGARRSVHDAVLTDLRELVELHHALDGAAADCWRGFSEYAGDLPANFDELRLALADEFESTPPPLTNGGTPRVNWAKNLAAAGTALRMGDWDSLLNLKLGQRAREDEGTFDRVAIPIDVAELFASADVLARAVLARRLTEQCRTMGRLTALFASALDRRQRETGAFGFAELTRLLGGGSPLCERPDIFYRLDARTQHIFLDEFQDTSLAQWQALEPLVDELLSGYEGERAAVV
ncbi:MAG TPA: UvrD-helicase domain-containing protein, partial [Longimicrobiaceae bacterium]|nr:UvrD-helicase domain-containing protein [Longimicrobiaceae bacterium]